MIQQEHLAPFPNVEKNGGKRITMPGLGVDIRQVLQQYAKGTLEERAKGYYDGLGMEIPEFSKMSRIEKLEQLNIYRDLVNKTKNDLEGFGKAKKQREEEEKINKRVKKEVDEKLSAQGGK